MRSITIPLGHYEVGQSDSIEIIWFTQGVNNGDVQSGNFPFVHGVSHAHIEQLQTLFARTSQLAHIFL